MDDAGAVQRRHCAGERDGDIAPFLQSERRTARKPRLQKFSLIERHDRVQAGLASGRQLDDAPDRGIVHPSADPSLADESRAVGVDAGDLGLGELQGNDAALDFVLRAEQPRIAAIGDQRLQDKSIDRLAANRHRNYRQLQDGGADVGRSRSRQRDYIQNQSGAIVGAAGLERGRNQRAGGILGSGAFAQDVGDALFRQKPVHAVTAQQEAVVQRHRLRGIVEAHFRLHSQRTVERVRAASAVLAHMVGGEASHALAAQPIGAGIPDMQQVGDAAAQHQRRQRATHSG